jgi:hypothetical protein
MKKDVVEPEAVAVLIGEVLLLLPPGKRADALVFAVRTEDAEREEREKHGGWRMFRASEIQESPSMRYWNHIMQLRARLAYTFIRTIRNNHSAEGAARLLFQYHRNAPGSGYLEEYLDGLPQLTGRQRG